MKEIGAILKAAREEKGLSLADLQMLTKIRVHQLAAMEAGDFHKLPGEVYVRGFLINYAKNVGLDPEPILAQYYAEKKQAVPEGEAEPGVEAGTEEAAVSRGRTGLRKSLEGTNAGLKKANLLVMTAVGLVVLVGLAVGKYFAGKPDAVATTENGPVTETEEKTTAPANPLPSVTGPAENGDRTGEAAPVEPETAVAAPGLSAEKGRLVVEAREAVWLGLYQWPARTVIFEGTLQPGEKREWVLTADVSLRIGNAGGVRVVYEGQDLGALGASGQVVTKVITVD